MSYRSGSALLVLTTALLATTGAAGAAGPIREAGSITHIGSSSGERGFLRDGGSIRSESFVVTPFGAFDLGEIRIGGDGPFLEDGGSIRTTGGLRRYDARRSITTIRGHPAGYGGFHGFRGSSYYRGTGTGAPGGGTTIIYGDPDFASDFAPEPEPAARRGGAKIIHVASARLDRRPIPKSGIETMHVGATRIIRIAPDYRIGGAADEAPSAGEAGEDLAAVDPATLPEVYYPDAEAGAVPSSVTLPPLAAVPVPEPAPRERADAGAVPAEAPATGFEPWTAEWLRDCVDRYPTFDASLGTYTDEAGRRRFCTGEP